MPNSAMPPIDEAAVRTRAYLLWEADGYPDGRADHYWGLAYAEATTVTAKPRRAAATAASPVPEKTSKSRATKAKPAAGPAKSTPKTKKPKA